MIAFIAVKELVQDANFECNDSEDGIFSILRGLPIVHPFDEL